MISIIILSIVLLLALSVLGWQTYKLSISRKEIISLQTKYQVNPSYDCQVFMADVMAGQGLFKIERVDREDLFLFRR